MSTERMEFRPIETAPARRVWPFAVLGAVVVGLLVWIGHRSVVSAETKPVALASVAPKIEPKAVAEAAKPETAAAQQPKAAEGPNVLGNAVAAAGKLAMVARAELDRELGRTRAAQKEAALYRKQMADMEKQLTEARAQIAALQRAKQPPPPSDQEQILQMLAPVLRSGNDGRP